MIVLKLITIVKETKTTTILRFIGWGRENSKIVAKTAEFVDYHLRVFVVVFFDKVGFFCNIHFSYSNWKC